MINIFTFYFTVFIKITLLSAIFILPAFSQKKIPKQKKVIINSIEEKREKLIEISDNIWEAAELSLREFKSSKYLSDYAEENGFIVEKELQEFLQLLQQVMVLVDQL